MERINLVDLDFNSFSLNEKRISFITMDMVMKSLHKNNKVITSFMPQDIYYDKDTTLFVFGKVRDIDTLVADNREEAIRDNIIGLSTLAFCSYLKTYDPKNGLLNNGVIADDFDKFVDIFDRMDVEYYRNVLVIGVKTGTIPEPIYYTDTMIGREKSEDGNQNNRLLVRATEVGKAMYDNNETGFGTQFFLVSMVACFIIGFIGFILYFLNM